MGAAPPGEPAPSEGWRGWAPWLLMPALAWLLNLWPWPARPLELLGHPAGEAPNHLAMLWRAWEGSPALGNLPEGTGIPLMDPSNLLPFAAGAWADPALGYGLMVAFNLALAGLGAAALAASLGGGAAARSAAAVAGVCAPFLGGVVSFGITEALPVGWLGLHLAAAFVAMRAPGGRRRASAWWLASGLALALFVGAGWYHAVFALPVEAGLLLLAARRHGIPATLGTMAQGALAVALHLPRFLSFWERRGLWAERWAEPPCSPPEGLALAWRHTPLYGADLLNLLLPALEPVPVSKCVYLGGVTLALAFSAGARGRCLLALSAPLLVLALGFWLRVGGAALAPELGAPARWLTSLFPPLAGLSHWHRAVGPATVLLAAAAGLGVERLASGRPRARLLVAGLCALLMADGLLLSQTPWPRATMSIAPPAVYAEMTGPGALVELPFDNGRAEFVDAPARVYERWQPRHGRAISESYEGPDALLRQSRLIAAADGLCGAPQTQPRAWQPPPSMRSMEALVDPRALEASVQGLRRMGVGWVALHSARAPTAEAARALLTQALGPPIAEREGVALFKIP